MLLKMDKLAMSQFLFFMSMCFTKCIITFAFLNIFARNFQDQCKTKFLSYFVIGIFDFDVAKIFPEKI